MGAVPNGEWYKLCTGPAHEKPEYLPVTEKYFYFHKTGKEKGQPTSRCRLCNNWSKVKTMGSYQGVVPVSVARRFFIEAVNRIGAAELERRTGVTRNTIRKAIVDHEGNIRKSVLRRVMLELTSIQRKNEHSISERSNAKWYAEQRLHNGYQTCPGCGTPTSNFTSGCDKCIDRLASRRRRGTIEEREYLKIKERLRLS